jgi:hypothetical protein
MNRILSHLTYANVTATAALFIALGGTAVAAVVVSDNSQVAANTISGHNPPEGDHANIISTSLDTVDLAPGSVTGGRLANGSVSSAKILDGGVQLADLGANSVDSTKIADGQVKNNDLIQNAVSSGKIADGQVQNADLAPSAVDSGKIADGQVKQNDLAKSSVNSGKIQDGQVQNADLGFGAVDASKVQFGSLTGTEIQNRGLSDSDIGSPAQILGADLPTIPANGCIPLQLNFGGWDQVSELVFAQARDGELGQSGLFITPLVVTTPGSAFGRICNVTAANLDPGAEDILAWSIRQ